MAGHTSVLLEHLRECRSDPQERATSGIGGPSVVKGGDNDLVLSLDVHIDDDQPAPRTHGPIGARQSRQIPDSRLPAPPHGRLPRRSSIHRRRAASGGLSNRRGLRRPQSGALAIASFRESGHSPGASLPTAHLRTASICAVGFAFGASLRARDPPVLSVTGWLPSHGLRILLCQHGDKG